MSAIDRNRLLPPGPNNPRNSEGDFITLRDGRILFVYTHFVGTSGSDHAAAHLAGRFSDDGGQTWSDDDTLVVANHAGQNVMSVSLLRAVDGRILLFYMRKDNIHDCCPVLRVSTDEAASWSAPADLLPRSLADYYVLNNSRVIQLSSGRIVVPLSRRTGNTAKGFNLHGEMVCCFSDDGGVVWEVSAPAAAAYAGDGTQIVLQEPGLIERRDGSIMMLCRTHSGCQYRTVSTDQGSSWSQPEPTAILSPCSPASLIRLPATGDLLMVWNDHRDVAPDLAGKRTPFTAAVSSDDGLTWSAPLTLEDAPHGWYCYTAIHLVDDHVLLGHCAGDRRTGGLQVTQITRFPIAMLYG
jgi:predicted neuraminidase